MIVENNDSENNTAGHHPHDEVEVGPNLEYEYLIHTNSNFIIILEEKRPANVTCIFFQLGTPANFYCQWKYNKKCVNLQQNCQNSLKKRPKCCIIYAKKYIGLKKYPIAGGGGRD